MSSEFLYEIASKFDIAQLLAIAAMFYLFKNHLDKKFDKIDARFEKLETRVSSVQNQMIEVKTILRMKECCMISDDSQKRKAE